MKYYEMNLKISESKIRRLYRGLIGVIFLSFVVACAGNSETPKEISQKIPIDAELVTFFVKLKFSIENEKLYATDEVNFHRYVKEYHRRGRSKLSFATANDANIKMERVVLAQLNRKGISDNSIVIKRGKAKGKDIQGVEFSFKGYVVSVPKCGNWLGETGHNPTNKTHVNFGCAYYRNLGLMLSDPGELSAPQGLIENDARRMDKVIHVYRDGSAAGVDLPKSEAGKFASPGSN